MDTSYVFNEYTTKYNDTFLKLTKKEKELLERYGTAKVRIKKSSYEKEYKTTISQDFNTIEKVPDLYKIENYASDMQHNYALKAEEHYYNVSYSFDGNVFKRIVAITDPERLKIEQLKLEEYNQKIRLFTIVQTYTLNYHFPRKIISVSNNNAKISKDKKSVSLQFKLLESLMQPDSTNLEIVLEQ